MIQQKIKKRFWRYFLLIIVLTSLAFGIAYGYWVYFDHRFLTVSANKVYRSGQMPPHELQKKVRQHGVKTVIDLRNPSDNEADNKDHVIEKEDAAMQEIGVKHVNLPADQVPRDETVDSFLKIMQNQDNIPVLIHCHHGIGRAVLFSAIYRIEFEGWSNEDARKASRFISWRGSFSKKNDKGRYLLNYKQRLN